MESENVLAALAGVAGGLRGGVDSYTWQRQRLDRERDRQDVLNDRDEDRRIRQDAEARRQREDDDKKKAAAAQKAWQADLLGKITSAEKRLAAEARLAGLPAKEDDFTPPPIQGRVLPSMGLSTYDSTFGDAPSPGVAPAYSISAKDNAAVVTGIQRAETDRVKAANASAAAATKRQDDLTAYEDRKKVDARYRVPATPRATGPKDDPSLPQGVKQYLGTLRQKYGTLEGAVTEFNEAIDDLYADHPNLDTAKARRTLDTLYRPTAKTPTTSGLAGVRAQLSGAAGAPPPPAAAPNVVTPLKPKPALSIDDINEQVSATGQPRLNVKGRGSVMSAPRVPDQALEQHAAQVLKANGREATPAAIRALIATNREALLADVRAKGRQ